jgi:hypothetical protein
MALGFSVLAFADRPVWAEKTTYTQGDSIYFVGAATNQMSIEIARDKALNNGKRELCKSLGLKSIDNLHIQTQRNYEETEAGGKLSVYRLMFVTKEELSAYLEKKTSDDSVQSAVQYTNDQLLKNMAETTKENTEYEAEQRESEKVYRRNLKWWRSHHGYGNYPDYEWMHDPNFIKNWEKGDAEIERLMKAKAK